MIAPFPSRFRRACPAARSADSRARPGVLLPALFSALLTSCGILDDRDPQVTPPVDFLLEDLDQDGSGDLTPDEMEDLTPAPMFRRADTDRDRRLSRAELQEVVAQWYEVPPRHAPVRVLEPEPPPGEAEPPDEDTRPSP